MRALQNNELDIISGGDLKGLAVGGVTGLAALGLKWCQGASWLSTALWGVGSFALGAGAYYGGSLIYQSLTAEETTE